MSSRGDKPTILVCDDDDGLRELMTVTLGEGYHYIEAIEGEAALGALATEHVDLVLLDVMLPGFSGLQVLEAMRSDERLRDVPVIVVSAWQSPTDQAAAAEAGADDFLAKPFELEELTRAVESLLERGR
jgi:DNA-binding response OmpR family regulator